MLTVLLCYTGGRVLPGLQGTPNMVEERMGACWSNIQVTILKFEDLRFDHKGILVSDLHG